MRESDQGQVPNAFSPRRMQTFLSAFRRLQSLAPGRDVKPPTPIDANSLTSILGEFRRFEDKTRESGKLINVWRLSGIGRDEVKNSAVLCWLLDSRGSHGVGSAVLNAFLAILKDRYDGNFPLPLPIESGSYFVSREAYQISDTESRIDVAIGGRDLVLFIEVKIDAIEGPEQLERYLKLAEKKAENFGHDRHAVIFLTTSLDGQTSVQSPRLIQAEWRDVAQAIINVNAERTSRDYELVHYILEQFGKHISKF